MNNKTKKVNVNMFKKLLEEVLGEAITKSISINYGSKNPKLKSSIDKLLDTKYPEFKTFRFPNDLGIEIEYQASGKEMKRVQQAKDEIEELKNNFT